MEMLFVVGNRTRSCCQATALQRRASGCEHLCRGRSTAGAANPGCWGGHRPTEPGVPQLLPQGKGGDGAAPLPCLPRVPVRPGARCSQGDSVAASSSGSSQRCSAGRVLASVCRAPGPPSALIFGCWGVPFTHSAAGSLLLPIHPSPSCGTASLQGWHNLGSSITRQIVTVKL